MRFQLVPSTITVTINFPALDRLIDYLLQSQNDNATKLAAAAAQLNQSSSDLKAATDAAQQP